MPLIDEHGRNAVGVYLGNPSAHSFSAQTFGPAMVRGARVTQRFLGELRRPDAQARLGRADVRLAALDPGARRRPHAAPPDPRREPARLERQPADGTRHARADPRDPRARRQGRRRSTRAARARPRPPTSTTSSGRAATPRLLFGDAPHALRRGPRGPGPARASTSPAGTRSSALAAAFAPEAVAPTCGIAGGRDPADRARARRRRERRGLRPHRHLHTGVRHARELARRRAERRDRQPRPRGRRDVHARGRRPVQLAAARPGSGKGWTIGRWTQPRARGARGHRRAARLVPRGGDRDAGRGPDPRADHGRRQPARLDPERGPADEGRRGPRLHALDRHLPQRDDPPRRRDPARARSAREVALRPRALPARGPQRGQLLPARCSTPRCRRNGRRSPASARCSPARGPTPTPAAFDDFVDQRARRPRGRLAGLAHRGPRCRRDPRRARAAHRPGADARPACCAAAPTATASARTPRA